ncbi:MAG: OmpH family outer membrane protein [Bacteroidia bacterium]|nr:OmpH family outer membrane protein [Bacteroidia bacterium]
MKKSAFIFLLFISVSASAQKFAYIDTQYILDNIPDYKTAQQTLDQISISWQKEIEGKYAIIDKLYKDYQAEQIILTEEMRKKREQEIVDKEKDVKELQKAKFGYEGELFKKKQELVKPIQDKIYNAIKKMATEQSIAVIFDKSSDLTILYAAPKYDKSDEVLTALGFKPGSKAGTASDPKSAGGGATPPTRSGGNTDTGDRK